MLLHRPHPTLVLLRSYLTPTSTIPPLRTPIHHLRLCLPTAANGLLQHRAMASSTSSSTPLQEWLVIVPDHTDALQKRIAARPKHLEGLKADREDMWLWGGAMLHTPIDPSSTAPPAMKGSACLIGAATREEVVERLKRDVYVQEGVWNLDEVQIIPFKSAVRKAL